MILDKNKFYQWDLERTLEIVDNIVTEVHFKKFTDNKLYVCEVYDNNGVRVVDIPNVLFVSKADEDDLNINLKDYNSMTGYTFINLSDSQEEYFTISARGISA